MTGLRSGERPAAAFVGAAPKPGSSGTAGGASLFAALTRKRPNISANRFYGAGSFVLELKLNFRPAAPALFTKQPPTRPFKVGEFVLEHHVIF